MVLAPALLTLLTLPIAAAAAIRTWPGASPCHTTLQACIAAATAGDIVEVASNGPIAEAIEIFGKSLTLRPAPGFTPVFRPTPFTDAIDVFGANQAVTITIEGMTVRDGTITAYQAGSGTFDVSIRNNVIEAAGLDANREAIRIAAFGAAPTGPVDFEILGNEVRLDFLQGDDIAAIAVDDLPGTTVGVIAGNAILDGGDWSTLAAIELRNAAGHATLDVLGNRIDAAGYNGGILLLQDGAAGSVEARIVNNLVAGTIAITGPQPAGISLRANAGSGDVLVLNNTLAGNDAGFIATAAAGATLTGVLANTLVAGNGDSGIVIDAGITTGFVNEYNLVFGNGSNTFVPGPGTVQADPLFAGAGDYRLQAGSPARDAGNDARVPADIVTDLAGGPRITGPDVDIGAYELSDLIFADGFEGLLTGIAL